MLEILLTSGVLIVILALLRLVFRGRIHPRLQYALWALVLLRLLIPGALFQSPVSVARAAAPVTQRVQAAAAQPLPVPARPDAADTSDTPDAPREAARSALTPAALLRFVWLAGAVIAGVWLLCVNLALARRLRRSRVPYGTASPTPVYVAQGLPSPCLFGLFRPAVYLTPDAAADPERAAQVIVHELTHKKHGDHIWGWLRCLCLAVYFFDPLVWLAAALSRRDCELYCDYDAVKKLGESRRYEYGRTLLSLTAVKARPGDLLCGATTMTGGKSSLRERIAHISKKPRISTLLCAAAILAALVAAGCTFSGAQNREAVPEATPAVTPTPAPVTEAQDEFVTFYEAYLNLCSVGDRDNALALCYYPDESLRALALDSIQKFTSCELLRTAYVNDDLKAFTVLLQTAVDPEPVTAFNFVGRLDDQLYVFTGASLVPEDIAENLVLADYSYQEALPGGGEVLGSGEAVLTESIQNELLGFAAPAAVELYNCESLDGAPAAITTLESVVTERKWTASASSFPANDPQLTVILTNAIGDRLWLFDDDERLYIDSTASGGGVTAFDCGARQGELLSALLPWAQIASNGGWANTENGRFYYDASGAMLTGWQKLDGDWFYLDPDTGVMQTGWLKTDGSWFYLDPDTGVMQTGWVKYGGA